MARWGRKWSRGFQLALLLLVGLLSLSCTSFTGEISQVRAIMSQGTGSSLPEIRRPGLEELNHRSRLSRRSFGGKGSGPYGQVLFVGMAIGIFVKLLLELLGTAWQQWSPAPSPPEAEVVGWPRPAWLPAGLNFAVTGQSGVGKSSMINALRGIEDTPCPPAAPVGVGETTDKASGYAVPNVTGATFFDLPGFGTQRFSDPNEYAKEFGLRYMNALIVVTGNRVFANDIRLVKLAVEYKIPVYFLRNFADTAVRAEKRKGKDAQTTIRELRDYLDEQINQDGQILRRKSIYIVDSWEREQYDMQKLGRDILRDLLLRSNRLLPQPASSMGIVPAAPASIVRMSQDPTEDFDTPGSQDDTSWAPRWLRSWMRRFGTGGPREAAA